LNNNFSDKDKKDWENFLSGNDRLPNKDLEAIEKKKPQIKSIDLHGYSIEDANKVMEEFIISSYEQGVHKLKIVTGKGLHSQNEENPYVSKDLSILKYSVPDFITKNKKLINLINDISDAKIEDGGSGAFYIYLKKK
tara:strand:+ start:49 stop:459 length:411 start_codon:yes stop_codon:yes gene_type:complete